MTLRVRRSDRCYGRTTVSRHDDRPVLIDPRCKLTYYTYILRGLDDLGRRYRFVRLDGPVTRYMRMRDGDRRIIVDAADDADVDAAAYEWADVMGKVNCTDELLVEHPNIRMLGPLWGLQQWPMPVAYAHAARAAIGGANLLEAIRAIRFQGKTRLPINAYVPATADDDYVFHRSRDWGPWHPDANQPRYRFFQALESIDVRKTASLEEGRISLADYLAETGRSTVVFNSPAVVDCLGWKLGEYLALGKAIVSTPLGRALPEPLVHGEHIHFVDDSVDAIRDALLTVLGDRDYRMHLERGARHWFERNLTPAIVVRRLLAE
ncbi:MAG: hypothetical protein RI900_1399 [Actinomycetota bacterium]